MNKKQIVASLLALSVLFNLEAGIKDWFQSKTASFKRGAQCAFAPGKYKCSPEERKISKKWLIGVSVGAAVTAATAIGVGVTAHQIKKAKEQAAAEEAAQAERAAQAPAIPGRPTPTAPTQPTIPEAPPAPAPAPPVTQKRRIIPTVENIKELSKDITQAAKAAVTPMQQYFEQQVIPQGANIIQQASQRVKKLLDEKTAQANQALSAAQDLKEAFVEKATKKLEEAEGVGKQFIQTIRQEGNEFFNNAVDQVIGVKIRLIQPLIQSIQEYVTRSVTAIKPIYNVRLMGQLRNLTGKISEFGSKASALTGKWGQAIAELPKRAVFRTSHVRPVALGGKTNEQIEQEAAQYYPLAKIADDIWAFYPQVIRQINELKLGGPGIILQNFLKLAAQLLSSIQNLNKAVGKVGKVIISTHFARALGELEEQLETLASQIRQTLTVKPILKEFPSSTTTALLEAARGYTWRVGSNLTSQIASGATAIGDIYSSQMAPAIANINKLQAELMSTFYGLPGAIKGELIKRVKEKPLLNTIRAPYILAQALGSSISKIKEKINQIASEAGKTINGLAQILSEAPSLARTVNTAVGGEFVNRGIIEGLEAIKSTSSQISQSIVELNNAIQESAAIVPGQ